MPGELLGQSKTVMRAGLLLMSYIVMIGAAAVGMLPLFAVAGLAAIVSELSVAARWPVVRDLLERVGIMPVYRSLARDFSVVLLLAASLAPSGSQTVVILVVTATAWAAAVGSGALSVVIDRWTPQTLTHNIDLDRVSSPQRPPAWAGWASGDRLALANVVLVPGAFASVVLESLTPFLVAGAVAIVVSAVVVAALGVGVARSLGTRSGGRPARSTLQRWLDTAKPRLVVYFAGPAKDVYQVDMWLGPVAALEQPAVIILRDRDAFAALADTRLPVMCVPNAVTFMNLAFDSVRAALYPANVGGNIHMLREPGMTHAFIGHGDSDKQASVNPFSKVYDEVWVAGRAGRERYARAAVGVEDRDIVEVGRPQLAAVRRLPPSTAGRSFTVLYAPTWEGWVDTDQHTSLMLMGESIVRGLLAISPAVRVIYKPHPLTGTRRKDARAANARVTGLVRAAGGLVDAASLIGTAHRVVAGAKPGLFDCFNETDLLISDVSSVVADFVQSKRPYVVANPANLPDEEFRRAYPTARAAYLLSADCGDLEKIIDVTRGGLDPMREARRELKDYLLGPDEHAPLDRFRAEVSRLCDRALRHPDPRPVAR